MAESLPYPVMDWSSTNLPDAWNKFKKHCGLMFDGPLKGKNAKEKCAYILLWVGDRGRTIHESWNLTEEQNKSPQVLYDKFKEFVQPKANPVCARYKFRHEFQNEDTIDEYITRLTIIANNCDYGDYTDEMIRDQIIFGCRSDRVREKLIERGHELTMDMAKQIIQAHEYNKREIDAMKVERDVDAIRRSDAKPHGRRRQRRRRRDPKMDKNSEKESICSRCGHNKHKNKKDCPAMGEKCNKCGKLNHFARMCRSESQNNVHLVENSGKGLESNGSSSEEESFYVYTVGGSSYRSDLALVNISICKQKIDAKIDTGSQVNILPLHLKKQLNINSPMLPPDSRLRSYTGDTLTVLGKMTLQCRYKDRSSQACFYIVDQENVPALLNLETARELGLIKLTYAVTEHAAVSEPSLREYSDVFEGIGQFDGKCSIKLKDNATPVVCATRKVPHALQEKLKCELSSMENKGIITKVTEPTDWVNALVCVEKPNGKIRICIDPKALNDCIQRPYYPMRTIDDITAKLTGAKFFSVLDATKGYYSCQLTDESSRLTTFATPFGRFRYLRLPMGLKNSQDIYNRKMDEILEGLNGIACIVDDIIVYGKNEEEHDRNLKQLLIRAREKGLKFNPEKTVVKRKQVNYFGHVITDKGLSVDKDKVSAILNMKTPESRQELETILGMLTYLSKFAPNLADETSPMRMLLKKDTEFIWGPEQDKAFHRVKQIITQAPVLSYFDPAKPVTLQVDASSKGIGCACLQDGKPIAYASKTLTESQKSWAQIEKELLAILFACLKFKQYIYGKRTTIESDCKPLTSILKKPLCVAPPRLQRMLLQLQPFDIEVIHKKGTSIPLGDALSRNFESKTYSDMFDGLDTHVHTVLKQLPISDQRLQKIRKVSRTDQQIQRLIQVMNDSWPELRQNCPKSIVDFWNHRDELSFEDGLLFKGQKIVIPKTLRSDMVKAVHDNSHQGCNQATRRACDIMFWPGMSKELTDYVLSCPVCEKHRSANAKEPLIPHDIPQRPWQNISCDLFAFENQQYLITVDAYSRHFEIDLLPTTKSITVIRKLKVHFSRFGIPEQLKSDNGPQFTSADFSKFANDWHFNHVTSSPNHQSSNGLSEIYVKHAKRILRKAKDANCDPYLPLLEYRNTPLQCGYSPAQLLMGRRLRSVLPSTDQQLTPSPVNTEQAREKMVLLREKSKFYYDQKTKPLPKVVPGQRIMFQKSPGEIWERAKILQQNTDRSYDIQTPDGATYRRNRIFINRTKPRQDSINGNKNTQPPIPNGTPASVSPSIMSNDTPNYVTRSGRRVHHPRFYSQDEWET